MTGPAATSSVIQDWISAAYNPPADIHIYRVCSQNGGDRLDVGSAAGAAAMRVNGAAGWINLGFDFVHADTSQNIPATLLNGWVNYLNTYCVAAYQKKNDIVYVQGLVRSGTVGGVIMNLPVGYRPPNDLIIGVDGSGAANSNRILEVRANGDIAEMSNIQMGNAGYLSLDGINFSITP